MIRTSKIINTLGLVLGIVGGVFIFIWGPPQPSFNEGVGLSLENNTPIDSTGKTALQYSQEVKMEKAKYECYSKVGLGLIMFGFVFQAIAIWIPESEISYNKIT